MGSGLSTEATCWRANSEILRFEGFLLTYKREIHQNQTGQINTVSWQLVKNENEMYSDHTNRIWFFPPYYV